jgi:hypothetical protein
MFQIFENLFTAVLIGNGVVLIFMVLLMMFVLYRQRRIYKLLRKGIVLDKKKSLTPINLFKESRNRTGIDSSINSNELDELKIGGRLSGYNFSDSRDSENLSKADRKTERRDAGSKSQIVNLKKPTNSRIGKSIRPMSRAEEELLAALRK